MIAHYDKMINALKSREDIKILEVIKNYDGSNRTGDKYIRNLFYCGLVYYVDKFGEKDLEKAINKIFIWAYTLRLKLYSVGLDSIDNYALNKAHSLTQLFKKIREAVNPNEILNLKLDTVKDIKSSKTDKIEELFEGLRYYVRKN